MVTRGEFEWSEVAYPDALAGQAGPTVEDADHTPHAFLYLPDLANETGWASHRVPERREERRDRREMGFRR